MKKLSESWRTVILCTSLMLGACGGGGGDGGTATSGGGGITTSGSGIGDGGESGGDQYGSGPDPVADPSGNPTSYQLINDAQAAGTITAEQSLIYKMYSDFADPRLPVEYQGDDTGFIEGDAPQQVQAYIASVGIGSVSPATLDTLRPFFVPAYYEGSWWHQQNSSSTQTAAVIAAGVATTSANRYCQAWKAPCSILDDWKKVEGTNVVVWYLAKDEATDQPKAAILVKEFDSTIWPRLTGLMGRTPLSDAEYGSLVSETDGRLDVLLADMPKSKEGLTLSSGLSDECKAVPVHIYLNRNLSDQGLTANAAHEFMHSIQFSINTAACLQNYYTTIEATAVWATNFVYPDNNWEHSYAKHYLKNHWFSNSYDDTNNPSLFRYGAYLFPLFLQTRYGPSIVKGIWDNTEKYNGEKYAIDGALGDVDSSFEKEWPKFAAANWNRHTIATYLNFDGLTDYADPNQEFSVNLKGDGSGFVDHNVSLPHASMAYYRVTFDDPAARSIAILNGLSFVLSLQNLTGMGDTPTFTGLDTLDREGASMQVYVKVNGSWLSEPTNLTNAMWTLSCRDDPAGNIDEMIFIYANAETHLSAPNYDELKPRQLTPGVMVSDIGCHDWTGKLSMTRNLMYGKETLDVSSATFTNLFPTDAPIPGDGLLIYPLNPADGPITPGLGWEYALTSGTATWDYADDGGGCTRKGHATLSIANNSIPVLVLANLAPKNTSADHGVSIPGGFLYNAGQKVPQLSYDWSCTDGTHGTNIVGTDLDIQVSASNSKVRIGNGGLKVSGTEAQARDSTNTNGTWSLTGMIN